MTQRTSKFVEELTRAGDDDEFTNTVSREGSSTIRRIAVCINFSGGAIDYADAARSRVRSDVLLVVGVRSAAVPRTLMMYGSIIELYRQLPRNTRA